ncbi:MAG TPA: leucyl aminopeptidase family protein [Asticcacaulis sp.]|nr:leucyl aminopeptidase family protein [Asticcacaulis sp.]
MPKPLPSKSAKSDFIVHALFEEEVEEAVKALKPAQAAFLTAKSFTGKAASLMVIPGEKDGLMAWFGLGARKTYNPLTFRALPAQLPKGKWALQVDPGLDLEAIHVAWGLGAYSFDRYKKDKKPSEVLIDDSNLTAEQRNAVEIEVRAHNLIRDLVNTPANDMGPAQIATAAREVADANGAIMSVIVGDDLLKENYPAVHAVGRAAAPDHAPRFIELSWKGPGVNLPVIALVGKGVAFDTGGLNLKPGASMGGMKKDMGGAAHALALADWIMASQLPVDLHLFIPAVENSVSGSAMRPSDVIASRAGLSIEVGNTDAEGRLILADALTRAAEYEPALTIDFATLTGAARVALGPDVQPFYCDDEEIVRRLEVAGIAQHDPLWRMPLWQGYMEALESDIADVKNDPAPWAQAGSITAALFLSKCAPKSGVWVHFDIFSSNARSKPGAPSGAEAQGLRAVYHLIKGVAE